MTKKEQLLMAITMLDESDCEYVLKILSEETRKDFEKKVCKDCGEVVEDIYCIVCYDKLCLGDD